MSTSCKLIVIELRLESSIQGFEGLAENITWNCTALEDGAQARATPMALYANKQARYGGGRVQQSRGRHSKLKRLVR